MTDTDFDLDRWRSDWAQAASPPPPASVSPVPSPARSDAPSRLGGPEPQPGGVLPEMVQLRRDLAWRRLRGRMFQAGEVLAACIALAVGGLLGWRAASHGDLLSAGAAAALVTAALMGLAAARDVRRWQAGLDAMTGGAAGVLAGLETQLAVRSRIARYWRASAGVLLLCAVGVLGVEAAGGIGGQGAWLLAATWAGTAAILLLGGLWRQRLIRREQAVLERLRTIYARAG